MSSASFAPSVNKTGTGPPHRLPKIETPYRLRLVRG